MVHAHTHILPTRNDDGSNLPARTTRSTHTKDDDSALNHLNETTGTLEKLNLLDSMSSNFVFVCVRRLGTTATHQGRFDWSYRDF